MRAGVRFECSRCGLVDAPRDEVCEPSCRHARDEHGRRPPPPSSMLISAHPPRSLFRLTTRVGEIRARQRWRAWLREAGAPVPVALHRDGYLTVRGTVEVLAAPEGHAEDVAAYRSATLERSFGLLDSAGTARKVDNARIRRAAGRFLVRDETGVALVDDDWLELIGPDLQRPSAGHLGRLYVYEGDEVTVVGHARRSPLPGMESTGAGYREVPTALQLDGDHARPVLLITDNDISDA